MGQIREFCIYIVVWCYIYIIDKNIFYVNKFKIMFYCYMVYMIVLLK